VEFSGTASLVSQTSFKIAGDQTTDYTSLRRVRLKSGTSTRYGTIVSASYTTETTVTITVDNGSLSASHTLAAISAIDSNSAPSGEVITAASIAALRLLSTAVSTRTLVNVLSWVAGRSKGGGVFKYVSTDTTSTDNSGTIIVDALGRRWYRIYQDSLSPFDFGAYGDATTNDTTAVQAVFTFLQTAGGKAKIDGRFRVTATTTYTAAFPIIVEGNGHAVSELIYDFGSANQNGLRITLTNWHSSLVPEVKNIGISANYVGQSGIALGIYYTNYVSGGTFKGPTVENIRIRCSDATAQTTTWWRDGMDFTNCPHPQVTNNWIQGGVIATRVGAGINFGDNCISPKVIGNNIYSFETACYNNGVNNEGVLFTGNYCVDTHYGYYHDTAGTQPSAIITDNGFDCNILGFYCQNLLDLQLTNNEFFAHDATGVYANTAGYSGYTDIYYDTGSTTANISGNVTGRALNLVTITGITQANPAVVTYSGADNIGSGIPIFITGVNGMTEVNNVRFVAVNLNIGANTFELSGINSTGYGAYTSGGEAEIYSVGVNLVDGGQLIVRDNQLGHRSEGVIIAAATSTTNVDNNYGDTTAVMIKDNSTAASRTNRTTRNYKYGAHTMARVSSNQTLTTAVAAIIANWGVTEGTNMIDRGAVVPNSTTFRVRNNVRTINIKAQITFASNATGYRKVEILKNGVAFLGTGLATIPAVNGTTTTITAETGPGEVVFGDYFEVEVTQNSGGNLDVVAGNGTTFTATVLA
jgi:hypothetical protein